MDNPRQQKNVYSVPFLSDQHGEFVLWFFTGSKCNLSCTHCYVDSGPDADRHPQLTLKTFNTQLQSAVSKKYRRLDIYFTGGEPFINENLLDMFELSLKYGDVTVLTNATRISKTVSEKLRVLEDASTFSLNFRVSLEGSNSGTNDKIRGKGAFDRAEKGIKNLIQQGFNPIVTSMRSWPLLDSYKMETQFVTLLTSYGIPEDKQRLKILPPLRIGRETDRDRPYQSSELFTEECFDDYDYNNLQCSKCRIVTERGVWVCPILVNDDDAKMSEDLSDSMYAYDMKQMACWTCRMEGMSCTND